MDLNKVQKLPVLSAQSIELLNLVQPLCQRTKHEETNMTYGLSMGGVDIRIDQDVEILPGEFRLASSMELFNLPTFVMGTCYNKSTLARRGLNVLTTILEPNWRGFLTLEMSNVSKESIYLPMGSPIAQIVFSLLDKPTRIPYEGKYQNQKRGIQEAL